MLAGDTFAQITGLFKCFDPESVRKRTKEPFNWQSTYLYSGKENTRKSVYISTIPMARAIYICAHNGEKNTY